MWPLNDLSVCVCVCVCVVTIVFLCVLLFPFSNIRTHFLLDKFLVVYLLLMDIHTYTCRRPPSSSSSFSIIIHLLIYLNVNIYTFIWWNDWTIFFLSSSLSNGLNRNMNHEQRNESEPSSSNEKEEIIDAERPKECESSFLFFHYEIHLLFASYCCQ